MKNKKFTVLISAGVLFATAITGLAVEKMRITSTCKDVRLFMDGSYSATILSGGINHRTLINVYKRQVNTKVHLGTVEVFQQIGNVNGVPTETYLASNLKLIITGHEQPPVKGFPATLQATFGNENINAKLGCVAQ